MSDFKYKAFISYSHADEKHAKWLHRQLESYRVPKNLVDRNALTSNRLKPIFRDRDELGTSPSLSQAIEDGLTNSETLIVICSPSAAKSRWVDAEIASYKKLGRGNRIYCLIADGDPSTAFPPALLSESEALAADIQHDGKQNSFLKIAAGILEVPFDNLRQREQQARNRRLLAISGFSFAGMLIAVGLASFAMISRQQAVEAREEADTQRQVAERAEQVAVQEAETAQRISDVMIGMFEVSDPGEARGNSITARELLDKGAEDIQSELADQPVIQATLNHTIGDVYLSLGLYQASRELLELALNTRRETLGDDHPEVAVTLIRMAQLERDTGNLAQARLLYEQALVIRENTLGADHLEVAEALNDLAGLTWEMGEYDESQQLYERTLQIREQSLPADHPDVAATLNGLASVAWGVGDYAGSSQLFDRSLTIRRQSLGDDHPLVARTISNLAATYYMQDDFARALPLYEETVATNEKVLGPDHPEGIIGLSNLAEVLVELGDYGAAQSYYERAVSVGETIDPDYPDLGWPLDGLGTVYHRIGDYQTARIYFERALQIREDAYGSTHTDVADTLEGYAAMLESAGEQDEADNLLTRARSIRETVAVAAGN